MEEVHFEWGDGQQGASEGDDVTCTRTQRLERGRRENDPNVQISVKQNENRGETRVRCGGFRSLFRVFLGGFVVG